MIQVVQAVGRLAARAMRLLFGSARVRSFVGPIILYEGAQAMLDYLVYLLKWKSADMLIGFQSVPIEKGAFLNWAELTPEGIDRMTRWEKRELVERYVNMRVKAVPGSRLSRDLGLDEKKLDRAARLVPRDLPSAEEYS